MKRASVLRSWWSDRRDTILRLSVALMIATGTLNLGYRLGHLLFWGRGRDLEHRYDEAHAWFAGAPIYSEMSTANYPPASYALFWPFVGYSSYTLVKWIFAVTAVAALAWLATLLVKESKAQTGLLRAFVALMPLSMYATGSAIGHGQFTIQILPCLVVGLTLICRGRGSWREDLAGSGLVLGALVKPTISAPFFWLVLLVPGRLRPALLVGFGYLAVSLLATALQGSDILSSHLAWVENLRAAAIVASDGSGVGAGNYGNLNSLLGALGLFEWNLPASLLMLLALGYWTVRHRREDFWLLMGVVALVARFWSYHRLFDDMLILFPMIALLRIARQGATKSGHDIVSGVLLAVALLAVIVPSSLLGYIPRWGPLLVDPLRSLQTAVWVVMLLFLLHRARLEDVGAGQGPDAAAGLLRSSTERR